MSQTTRRTLSRRCLLRGTRINDGARSFHEGLMSDSGSADAGLTAGRNWPERRRANTADATTKRISLPYGSFKSHAPIRASVSRVTRPRTIASASRLPFAAPAPAESRDLRSGRPVGNGAFPDRNLRPEHHRTCRDGHCCRRQARTTASPQVAQFRPFVCGRFHGYALGSLRATCAQRPRPRRPLGVANDTPTRERKNVSKKA